MEEKKRVEEEAKRREEEERRRIEEEERMAEEEERRKEEEKRKRKEKEKVMCCTAFEASWLLTVFAGQARISQKGGPFYDQEGEG